jgi:hypothetical protein
MPSRLLSPTQGMLRDPAVQLLLMAIISVQLLAFYMLCNQQVQKAEERQTAARAERVATIDCLETLSQMTFASCALRSAQRQGSGAPDMLGSSSAGGHAVPAAYVLR